MNINSGIIPGDVAFKLYDTFGLDEEMINKIASINNLSVDGNSFKQLLLEHKSKHKAVFTETANSAINMLLNLRVDNLINDNVCETGDKYKYNYTFSNDGSLSLPNLCSELTGILTDQGELSSSLNINSDNEYHFIFNKTNFYCEEGGQCCDKGEIHLKNGAIFEVKGVSKIRGLVLHSGRFSHIPLNANLELSVGDTAELAINQDNRLRVMQHHTATHLLNAAIKKVLPDSVTCQLSSKVTDSGLILDLAVYGEKLSIKSINDAQELVR